jgi:hypothetical protein
MTSLEAPALARFNDDRLRAFRDKQALIAFVCECEDRDCCRTVLLSAAEFEARRPQPILHESHQESASPPA